MTSVDASILAAAPAAAAPATAAPSADDDSGFSFHDLLDIINPLQHIPVVSTIYRALSGDTIKDFPKIAGDTLYGGVEGFVSSVADTIFTKVTGKSFGDTVLAFAEDMVSPSKPADTGVAANITTAPATPAAASISSPAGEDLGDRIVDWFERQFSPSDSPGAAAATPAPPGVAMPAALPAPTATQASTALQAPAAPLQTSDAIVVPGQDALLMALSRSGVGQDMALRAADAYRRTLNVAGTAAAAALH